MRLLTCLTAFALVGLLAATPVANEDVVVKSKLPKSFYIKDFVKYTAEHDIVKITVPVNQLNHLPSKPNSKEVDNNILLFFVEADIQADGSRVDQGLYVFRDGKAKKILDNGRDAAASADGNTEAFFGAKDGLYTYNYETNSADKYGPITDSIIAIEKEVSGDDMYILTESREVFKVFDKGETKEKLDDVVNAKGIVVDSNDNLYFYADDKKPYVRTYDGIKKKIEGLPDSTGNVFLLRPPYVFEYGAPVVINDEMYLMFPNGTSKYTGLGYKPDAVPTAIAPEGAVLQYYAFNKKIYEYDLLSEVVKTRLNEIGNFVKAQEATINDATDPEESPLKSKSPLKRKLKSKA